MRCPPWRPWCLQSRPTPKPVVAAARSAPSATACVTTTAARLRLAPLLAARAAPPLAARAAPLLAATTAVPLVRLPAAVLRAPPAVPLRAPPAAPPAERLAAAPPRKMLRSRRLKPRPKARRPDSVLPNSVLETRRACPVQTRQALFVFAAAIGEPVPRRLHVRSCSDNICDWATRRALLSLKISATGHSGPGFASTSEGHEHYSPRRSEIRHARRGS